LAQAWLQFEDPTVTAVGDWIETLKATLATHVRVKVLCQEEELPTVAASIQRLLVQELEVDYLLLPLSIARVDRVPAGWAITLRVGEGVHV
jgi:hypothetical protein